MAGHYQGTAGPQAPPCPDGTGHRARRDVHRRDLRADRHAEPHVRHAVRQHLPERRFSGARRGPARNQRRQRDAQPGARVAPRHGAGGPRRGSCQRFGDRPCAVHRPRRQGHYDRRGTHARSRVRPQPADLGPPHCAGQTADDTERSRHGPRHGAEVPLHGRPEGAHPAAGPDPHLHHQRPDALRDGEQPGRSDPGRLRHPDRAGRPRRRRQVRQHQHRQRARVRTRRPSNTPSPACCPPASRW